MILVFYKAIAAFLIFCISIITIFYTLKRKHAPTHRETAAMGEALASGIFLGAAFFHMLPESITTFRQLYGDIGYPVPELICVSGFLLLLFLERFSLANVGSVSNFTVPYILTLTLMIHSLIEGTALGIGPTFTEAFMIFIAILAHKSSESFALCITLLKHQLPMKRIIFIVIIFACMTPIGIGIGAALNEMTLNNGLLAAASFNAFAAGSFLYISTIHHVHFHEHPADAQGLIEFACLVAGAAIMGTIAIWV